MAILCYLKDLNKRYNVDVEHTKRNKNKKEEYS